MTYAIVEMMYGVPLATLDPMFERSDQLLQWMDDNEADDIVKPGVHTYYHSSSDITPAAWGVSLRTFDETVHHTEDVSQLNSVQKKRIAAVDAAYSKLDKQSLAMLKPFGKPRLFLLWTSS
jgi:hypothetical protein